MFGAEIPQKKYKVYNVKNFKDLPQIQALGEEKIKEMEVVAQVLPFKANNYVVDELIDWSDPMDPIFILTFPQKGMLSDKHFNAMKIALESGDKAEIDRVSFKIRMELNPHPAGQMESNMPKLEDGTVLRGMQHKYDQTCLFFPSQSQTCHAYCTFCFRWPQFTGIDELKFAMKEADLMIRYLQEHPEITDLLFTGGDPMVMSHRVFKTYVEAILEADLPNLKTFRIGTKSLAYWPYKFVNEKETQAFLDTFKQIVDSGYHLSIMSHFNSPREMETEVVTAAIKNIRSTGAQIRSQTPLLKHINDSADAFARMWQLQIDVGVIPYYMFIARDTGAQEYFAVPLNECWNIYRDAAQRISGVGRTVRGPSMSCDPGKVQVVGTAEINGEKVFVLNMLQGRNPAWAYRPFFAKYDEKADWLDDLVPAFGEDKFFFENEPRTDKSPKKSVSFLFREAA